MTAALVITAIIDITDGAVSLERELSHLPEIISLVAVWTLTRMGLRRAPDDSGPIRSV